MKFGLIAGCVATLALSGASFHIGTRYAKASCLKSIVSANEKAIVIEDVKEIANDEIQRTADKGASEIRRADDRLLAELERIRLDLVRAEEKFQHALRKVKQTNDCAGDAVPDYLRVLLNEGVAGPGAD